MQWIKDIVLGLIETYETNNVYELIDSLDITIIKKDMKDNIKGYFMRDLFRNEYIYIDNNLNDYEEVVVLSHELGHAILHPNITTSYFNLTNINRGKLERQANLFAAELLISDEIDFNIYDCLTKKELSMILKVPESFIELKYGSCYNSLSL